MYPLDCDPMMDQTGRRCSWLWKISATEKILHRVLYLCVYVDVIFSNSCCMNILFSLNLWVCHNLNHYMFKYIILPHSISNFFPLTYDLVSNYKLLYVLHLFHMNNNPLMFFIADIPMPIHPSYFDIWV